MRAATSPCWIGRDSKNAVVNATRWLKKSTTDCSPTPWRAEATSKGDAIRCQGTCSDGSWKSRQDYLWKIINRPRIVAALISQGADLCHGWMTFDSTAAMSFFSSLGMFKFGLLQKKMKAECGLPRPGLM